MKEEFKQVGLEIAAALESYLRLLRRDYEPSECLWSRLLCQALKDWFKGRADLVFPSNGTVTPRMLYARQAYDWIMDDVDWFGIDFDVDGQLRGTISYCALCHILDLNAEAIRKLAGIRTQQELEEIDSVNLHIGSRARGSESSTWWYTSLFDREWISQRQRRSELALRAAGVDVDDSSG